MERRRAWSVAAIGVVAFGALLIVEPIPGDHWDLSTGEARRASVRPASLAYYDAPNDTTLAVFGRCGHPDPCGDAFRFPGNVVSDIEAGRWIIEPAGGATIERARSDVQLHVRAGRMAPQDYSDSLPPGDFVVLPPMEFQSVWPAFLAYVLTIAVLLGSLAALAGAGWGALAPPSVMGLTILVFDLDGGIATILMGAACILFALATAFFLRIDRRHAATFGCCLVAVAASAWLVLTFVPPVGGEI